MKRFFGGRKLRLLLIVFLLTGLLVYGRHILLVQATEGGSGGVPTSASDSRLKQLAVALEALSYGDPTDTVLGGDWGDYWNRIGSAAQAPFNDALINSTKNGGNADYPQSAGGIHDDTTLPTGSYYADWITCNTGNSYCGTGEAAVETTYQAKQDPNTGLIWSKRYDNVNWFTANNCVQPGASPNECDSNGDVGCKCVKLTESKTGCEGLTGPTGWRLPHQKELMMAYIDGASQHFSSSGGAAANHWSGTTNTTSTQNAWCTNLSNGVTFSNTKVPATNSFRCVR